jgi:hypothetical protein
MAGHSTRRIRGCGWPTPTEGERWLTGTDGGTMNPLGRVVSALAFSPFAWQAAFIGSGEAAN